MYEAEITSEDAARVICQRCKESFPPGTELIYLHNIDPSHPGCHLCEGCHKYYHEKGTTHRRNGMKPDLFIGLILLNKSVFNLVPQSNSTASSSTSESHSIVQHQIAAAQQGGEFSIPSIDSELLNNQSTTKYIEGTQPVVPIGDVGHGMQFTVQVPIPTSSSMVPTSKMTPSQPPYVIPGRQYKFNAINVVAPLNTHSMLPFPSTKSTPLTNPGYQDAHRLYNDMRKHFANKAYSTSANAELIIIKIWMMTRIPNKKAPLPVSVSRLMNCQLIKPRYSCVIP